MRGFFLVKKISFFLAENHDNVDSCGDPFKIVLKFSLITGVALTRYQTDHS